jgi:ppGpp synthetase/RelA/SpoT-type nucleotidyltranferase
VPSPESVRRAYGQVEPVLTEVSRYVQGTLEPYCREQSYLFIDRIKDLSSLSEKLETGRSNAWSDVDDLYACTVVVPVATHVESVLRKLDSSFRKRRAVMRGDVQKSPDAFRFDGIRWYGTARPEVSDRRQPGFSVQCFEVQVVTAFEYAWISVTHDLVYKSNEVDWRRFRLAAQLKAAVEQIEVLISTFDSASSAVEASPWPATDAAAEVVARCQLLVSDGLVPATLMPGSWRRFAENVCALVGSYERNRQALGSAVATLLDAIDRELRGPDASTLPVSGTLFQYFVAVVGRPDTPGNLNRFTVVPSQELSEIYGLSDLPREFVFDAPAVPGEPPH